MRTGHPFKKLLTFQGDSLEDLYVKNTLTNQDVPVVINNEVTHDFGSGINIISPAYDFKSLDVAFHYNLPKTGHVNEQGVFEDGAGIMLAGIDVKESETANKQILDILNEDNSLFLSYPYQNKFF